MEQDIQVNTIKIKTNDKQIIEIDGRFQYLSQVIKDILVDASDMEEIPLPNIDKKTLDLVIQYCKMHDFKPPKTKRPIKSGELFKNLHPKDYEFVKNYDIKTIKPLVDAASYLNIKSLADVCICRIATEYYIEPSMAGIEKAK